MLRFRQFLRETAFDFVQSARTDSRFDYIARYVQKETSTQAGRDLCGGLWVRQTPSGWGYGFRSKTLPLEVLGTSDALYDAIRRTKLNYFVRKAEAFREAVLTESSKPHVLYHGTAEKNVESILQKGLIPRFKSRTVNTVKMKSLADNLDRLDSVYFTRDKSTALEYATQAAQHRGSKPAIIRATIPNQFAGFLTVDEYDHRGVRWRGAFYDTNLLDRVPDGELQ